GEDGSKQHPIGMGPYKFVSHTPGIELVLDANEAYWRHPPYIKRIIMKGVPEGTTRLAMLKRGEADIAFALEGEVAEEVKRDPKLQLVDTRHASIRGSISLGSGTPSRPGMTSGCVWRPITPSIGRPLTRLPV